MRVLLFLLAAIIFTSCATFADDPTKSVWSEGLWILPWLTGLGSAFFFYQSYRAVKSGSIKGWKQNADEKFKFYKSGKFWFGIILLAATIVIVLAVIGDR